LTRSTTRAKGREPIAATNTFGLQLLLVGEDVKVGDVGLGVQI
jgi:hypothetical protein